MTTVRENQTNATFKTEQAKATASEAVEQTQAKAKDLVEQTQEKAREVAHEAKHQAKSAVETRKAQAIGGLQDVAEAVRQTGVVLRHQNKEQMANYTEKVAHQVERISSYLEEKDVDELLMEAENLARRQPGIFLAGAFGVGLLIGRFIKSSGERYEMARREYYYQTPGYPQQTYPVAQPMTRPETYGNPGVTGTTPSYGERTSTPGTTGTTPSYGERTSTPGTTGTKPSPGEQTKPSRTS